LGKSSATERDYGVAFQRFSQLAESSGLDQSKLTFSAITKNLGDGFALTDFDLGIQIHKVPSQPTGKRRSYGSLSGRHESDEKDGARVRRRRLHD
jgi:hypothetical protein